MPSDLSPFLPAFFPLLLSASPFNSVCVSVRSLSPPRSMHTFEHLIYIKINGKGPHLAFISFRQIVLN